MAVITNKEDLRVCSLPALQSEIADIVDKIMEEVVTRKCRGLSAIQIGINKRVFVYKDRDECIVAANPRIMEKGGWSLDAEGCLSVSHRYLKVRSSRLKVSYMDISGCYVTKELYGKVARVFLHEMDHLNGILLGDEGTGGIKFLKNKSYKGE